MAVEGVDLEQEVLELHLQDMEPVGRAGEISVAVERLAGLVVELGVALDVGCEEEEEEEDWVEGLFEHVSALLGQSSDIRVPQCLTGARTMKKLCPRSQPYDSRIELDIAQAYTWHYDAVDASTKRL